MKIVRTEHHQVNSEFTYDIPEADIAKAFGSVVRFQEIISHLGSEWDTAIGDEPTDEEVDTFYDFIENYNYDRYDDWWTDRKGGYDVTYEVDDGSEEAGDDYDSDEEVLH